jgi:mRNA interferase MazF
VGLPPTGSLILVRFPFSDLSQAKLRPALVLAEAGRGDWILCQITSNAFSDPSAIEIAIDDFHTGALRVTSDLRPSKLFTASESLISSEVGELELDKFDEILDAVIDIFQASKQP